MTHGARILVVDDEPQILRSLRTTLASHGYEVQTAATGEEALAAVDGRLPDLVVLDLVLPGLSGLEVCRRLRSAGDDMAVLMLSCWHAFARRSVAPWAHAVPLPWWRPVRYVSTLIAGR